ncbi:TonB-dependent receptor [Nitrospirillum pindoramense]|nr:TonB-dependent receptor [Nitrospirillum amazonense]
MRRLLMLSASVLALAAPLIAPSVARAADVTAADTPDATANADATTPELVISANRERGTATNLAVGQASLSAVQPQSLLNSHFIQDVASPISDYLAIAQFAPSASSSSPNGMGLSSKNATVRGFQDGEYNVTFDGIPFGDPNAFGHATTSFFPAPTLDHVVVDRGPGTASTVGNATFGGTMALSSNSPAESFGGKAMVGFGSGGGFEGNGAVNTGAIADTQGTRVLLDYDHTQSDGLLNYAGLNRDNALVKVQQPVGAGTTVTLFADYSDLTWNNFTQQTRAATAKFGKSFANLNDDPNSQQYRDYNVDHRKADFEYIGVQSDLGFLRLDNKAYTYALDDKAIAGADQTGATPNAALLSSGVPGAHNQGYYRAWGDIAKLEKDVGEGFLTTTIRTGIWAEHARDTQFQQSYNLATGVITALTPYRKFGSVINNYITESDTTQPFVELEWHPLPDLTIIPGFKHIDFSRTFQGALNFAPYTNRGDYSADLGSTMVNYRLNDQMAVYAQWAMGFQAPQVSVLESTGSSANRVSPQQTINYQTGFVYKTDRLVADIDGYYINFRNKVSSDLETVNGIANTTVYFNQGGVIYKGIEAEVTYTLIEGLAVTANGSLNSAAVKATGLQIANAPSSTLAYGLMYDKDNWFGSFLTKYVGTRYAGTGQRADNNPNVKLPDYQFSDVVVGYKMGDRLKVSFMINNLFNNRTATEGSGNLTNPTFYYLPGRNYMGTVTVGF